MKKLLLLFAVMLFTVGAWAQVYVTSLSQSIEPGKSYVFNCKASDHLGYLADESGVLKGRAEKPSAFMFENATEGKYYFKSLASGKYVNVNGTKISLDDQKNTEWTVTYQFNAFSISPSDKNYLNNAAGTNDIQIKNHPTLNSGNACSLWQLGEELSISDENNLTWYTIKNVRKNKYATYSGSSSTMTQREDVNIAALFYFTKGSEDGTVKIHNYFADDKTCKSYNKWATDGIDWYLSIQNTGVAISNKSDYSDNNTSWNDAGGNGKFIEYWNGSDAGSAWIIEKFTGDVDDLWLTLSNSDTKTFYNIKNHRIDKYVDYVGSSSAFKQESNIKYGSYWYFVDATSDLPKDIEIPANTKVCRIYNAANTLAVENPSTGYMSENSGVDYPAKIYFIRPYEHSGRFGYAIYPYNETGAGWNDYNSSTVCNHNFQDAGSIWTILPANKTANQLKQEATTAKNNALTLIGAAEEADFYTYPAEDIAKAKKDVEAIDVSTLETAVSSLVNNVVANNISYLNSKKGTAGPAVGQYIQLKNRKYKTYLKDNGSGLHGVNDATGNATLWLVVKGTDDKVKIQNAETGKYIGQIRQSEDVAMVDEASAKEFAFTNQTDVYAVFKETSGGDYAHGHIAGHNVLVGWERYADASQWIISEVSVAEALDELKAIHDVVDNAFGYLPGQYKQSMEEVDKTMHTTVEGVVKPMLEPGAVVDVPTARVVAATLKAQWDGVKTTVREINAPAQGKFYRLKNVASGNYMCGNASDVKLLADGSSVHTTIFYLGDKNTLLSYNSGRYLDCSAKGYSNVGVAKTGEFAMAYGGAQANVITYKNNGYSTYGAGADGAGLDRGSDAPNHIGYNWKLEEVTWLPIPVNVEAGYTTIYSPVELALSYNRFKAYTVSKVNAGYATLEEQTVVPAGVGVVLELQEGAQVEDGCVFLQVNANGTTKATSALLGTYADEYIVGDAYVLSMVDGEVGLYKAKLNQQGNTAFLNNGFKAYLPKPEGTPDAARFLVFDFGGTETAIEGVEGENGNVKTEIYDLAGRRVQNAQKGVFIVNGKVVIK